MIENGSYGEFIAFNCSPRDGYIAFRNSDQNHWRLYYLDPVNDGFALRLLAHPSTSQLVAKLASEDTERREAIRQSVGSSG